MENVKAKVGPAVLLFILILYCVINFCTTKCFSYKDCKTCTQHQTWSGEACRWCPLDNLCHAMWSPKNPCLKRQNIKHAALCNRPPRGQYNPHAAYKLALFSAIAYADEPAKCLAAVLPHDDFVVESVILVECDDYILDYKKQCMAVIIVSHDREEIIVAYRGTRGVEQIVEEILTMIGVPKVHSVVGGKVQHYFENVYTKLYGSVKKAITTLLKQNPDYSVMVTGHSLGGAVASITAAALVSEKLIESDDMFLYTFGMPRVGNKDYAESHNKLVRNSWRVVRDGDYITSLPRCIIPPCSIFNGPYHHGQKVLYEGRAMNVYSSYISCIGSDDSNSKCHHRRQKRGAIGDYLKNHKKYFGIPIGTYCRDFILKISTNNSTLNS